MLGLVTTLELTAFAGSVFTECISDLSSIVFLAPDWFVHEKRWIMLGESAAGMEISAAVAVFLVVGPVSVVVLI